MFFLCLKGDKKKTETAKKEYLKQLAAYRASLVSQVTHTHTHAHTHTQAHTHTHTLVQRLHIF